MILITGGAWQGKMEYAIQLAKEVGINSSQVADGKCDSFDAAIHSQIIHGLHEYIKRLLKEGKSVEEFLDTLEQQNPEAIIITNELGCGIVPMNPEDRTFRETSGRASVRLAKVASQVYRLVCGIPTQIK